MIRLDVPGRPIPKPRPRPGRNGGYYLPERAKAYQDLVAWYARQTRQLLIDRVRVDIDFYGANKRADVDNLCKAVCDGLQDGLLLANDRQVDYIEARRHDAPQGRERTIIVIHELGDAA